MIFILLKIYLVAFSKILKFASMIFIEGMCVVALMLVVMTISNPTFHLLLVILFPSD